MPSHSTPEWVNYLSLHQAEIDQLRREVNPASLRVDASSSVKQETEENSNSLVSLYTLRPVEPNCDVEMSGVSTEEESVARAIDVNTGEQTPPQEDLTSTAMDTTGDQNTVVKDVPPPSDPPPYHGASLHPRLLQHHPPSTPQSLHVPHGHGHRQGLLSESDNVSEGSQHQGQLKCEASEERVGERVYSEEVQVRSGFVHLC